MHSATLGRVMIGITRDDPGLDRIDVNIETLELATRPKLPISRILNPALLSETTASVERINIFAQHRNS